MSGFSIEFTGRRDGLVRSNGHPEVRHHHRCVFQHLQSSCSHNAFQDVFQPGSTFCVTWARQQSASYSEPVNKPALCTLVRFHCILLTSGYDGELIDRQQAMGLRQQGNAHLRTLFFGNMVLNGLQIRPAPKVYPFIRLARMPCTLVKMRFKLILLLLLLRILHRKIWSFFSCAPRGYLCVDGIPAFSITRIMEAHQYTSAHIC